MIHHRHSLRELVLSALSQIVAENLRQIFQLEEIVATQGYAHYVASVCMKYAVQVVQPVVQEVRRLAPCPCPF